LAEKDDRMSGPVLQPTLMYPENISLGNLMRFIAIPTLCYQVCIQSCVRSPVPAARMLICVGVIRRVQTGTGREHGK
jgi:hypothetical protein